MNFKKQDLTGTEYSWMDEDKDLFNGQPSRRSFDRYNGYQVLFLINSFGSLSERFTVEEGRSVERKLMNDLPMESKSEISVLNWIVSSAIFIQ